MGLEKTRGTAAEMPMKLKTKVFELCNGKYKDLSELAQVMGISVSQIYRVRQGKRHISEKFIVGAMKAFPEHKLYELFYLAPESASESSARTKGTTRKHGQLRQGNNRRVN